MPPRGIQRRGLIAGGWVLALGLCSGCAHPPPSTSSSLPNEWSGRLALLVHEPLETQPPSFSASFTLRGTPEAGELLLFSPQGNTLARLHWSPGTAQLEEGGQLHHAADLNTLLARLTGTALPIHAVFDWLHQRPTAAAGWHVDLSGAAQGRISAQRLQPLPQATLRILLTP